MKKTKGHISFLGGSVSSQGFTLLEVLIALALFSIAALVFLNSQMTSSKVSQTSENISKAVFLANQKISEKIIDIQKQLKNNSNFKNLNEKSNGDFKEAPGFRWEITLEAVEFNIPAGLMFQSANPEEAQMLPIFARNVNKVFSENMKKLGVKVFWKALSQGKKEQKEVEQNYSLTTYIANPKPEIKFEM